MFNTKFPTKPVLSNHWERVEAWKKLENIKLLGQKRRAQMKQRTQEQAQSEIAYQRINQMAPIAKRRHSESTKTTVKMIITIAGALTFASAMRIFASNLGRMAVPAALIGGGAASYVVDSLATSALTNKRRRQSAQKTINRLNLEQHKAIQNGQGELNELAVQYYDDQISLVGQIEGKYLEKQFPINTTLAGMLSSAEYITAFWIVSQVGAFGGIPIPVRAIAASLPVVLTWAASAIQSERFGLPEHYHNLIPQYQPYCFPSAGMSEDEVNKKLVNKEYEDIILDAGIKNIVEPNPDRRHKTPEMAEIEAEINYCQGIVHQLEQGCKEKVFARLKEFKSEQKLLPEKFPGAELTTDGMNPEQIASQKAKVEREREKWLAQQLPKLKEELKEDIEKLKADYGDEINALKERIQEAKEKYDEAYCIWRDNNEETKNDLGNAA